MNTENNSLNQANKHLSYDMTQKLTFFVIGIELVFCGYLLLNIEKLSGLKISKFVFLISGGAAFCGILWRFCYNQTYHENIHNQKSKLGSICAGVQNGFYYPYFALTFIFFIWILYAGYNYIAKAAHNKVNSAVAVDEVATKLVKDLQAVANTMEKISKDNIIHVEVVMKEDVKKQGKNLDRP